MHKAFFSLHLSRDLATAMALVLIVTFNELGLNLKKCNHLLKLDIQSMYMAMTLLKKIHSKKFTKQFGLPKIVYIIIISKYVP
jgi:hypothetical protein